MTNPIARRSKSYSAAELSDPDGVKTSFSADTEAQEFDSGDLNGAAIGAGGALDLPRSLTVTLSNTVGGFATDPIVITGKRGGATVTAEFTPTTANGNETLSDPQAFDIVQTVSVPAQPGTSGTFTIGVRDICAPSGAAFCGVELASAGDINAQYGEGSGSHTDTIPIAAGNVGQIKPIAPTRILTDSGLAAPTDVGLTVYLP